jgi:beta-hydroxyacyl-ACP dehydratase FabZ
MEHTHDIQKIMALLPHRYPFLLIDRILEIVPGERAVALKNVTINEPFFQGHFPKTPIMPGVLIVEAMGQAGGVLAFESVPADRQGSLIYFMGMDNVRFRKPVVPGDQMVITVQILNLRSKAIKMAGTTSVNGVRVAEAELLASIGDNK